MEVEYVPAHRWTVTVLCLYASGATGLIYLFSVYSDSLKKEFDLSQSEVESINTVMFVAGSMSVLPGALVDYIGPNKGVRLGGIVMACCFVIQFFVCTRKIDVGNEHVLVTMCTLAGIQFMSSACITASVFPTLSAMYKPHESRGLVIGEGKGWVGLFGAIVVQIYTGVMGDADDSPKTFDFLLFLAASSLILTQVTSTFLTKTPTITTPPLAYRNRLKIMVAVILLTCVVTTTGALIDSKLISIRLLFLTLLAILLAVPLISIHTVFDGKRQRNEVLKETMLKQGLLNNEQNLSTVSSVRTTSVSSSYVPVLSPNDKTTKEMLQELKCWLLLWCTFCIIGTGILITTNAGQMTDAVGASDGASSVAVTLFAVCQAIGRLSGGLCADEVKKLGFPSSCVLIISAALMTTGHLIMASSTKIGGIYCGTAVCGLGFGAVWPMMVVLAGDLYGTKSHGANYSFFDGMSSCFGSLVFGLFIPSTIYKMHQNSDGDCLEPECFSLTYGIAALADASAVIVSIILFKLSDKPVPFGQGGGGGSSGKTISTSKSMDVGYDEVTSPIFNHVPTYSYHQSGGSGSSQRGSNMSPGLILPGDSLESCELMEEERGSTVDPGSAHGVMTQSKKNIIIGAIV